MRTTGARLLGPLLLATATAASADPPSAPPPPLSLSARETLDLWDNASGGVRTEAVVLSKLQVSGTFNGDSFGFKGWRVHAEAFRTDGASLSTRVGDIQTVSNIEAEPTFGCSKAGLKRNSVTTIGPSPSGPV
jgi:hypothetical protein